ncbi:MAG: hypothetical protein AAGD86_08195 [Pseudomonadota bacterium]
MITRCARQARPGIWAIGLLAATLIGCGTPRPDLERLYRFETTSTTQPPVVFIHGFMGAKLRDAATGETLWPLPPGANPTRLALDIDGASLMPSGPPAEAFALSGDEENLALDPAIFEVLELAGGYRPADAGAPAADGARRQYAFLYDWRQDVARSAAELGAFIAQIQADHGNPDLKVDLVAHGTGGLVARWYLRFGMRDVQDSNEFQPNMEGTAAVRRAILLGTPNLGTIKSVTEAIYGLDRRGTGDGPRALRPEILATMPALYQRFPHPVSNWLTNTEGDRLDIDVYEASLWQSFGWSVFDDKAAARVVDRDGEDGLTLLQAYFARQIERARRFAWALSVPPRSNAIDYVIFGGACAPTPTKLLVEAVDGQSVLRLYPDAIAKPVPGIDYERLMLEPGDGTTPKSSLLARQALDPRVPQHKYLYLPIDYALFLCEEHNLLTGNLYFHDNLLHALLNVDGQ